MVIFLLIGLLLVAGLWLYTEPRPLQKRITDNIIKAYLIILTVVLPQFLSFFYLQLPVNDSGYIQGIGLILFILGLLLDIWSRITMGKYWGPPGQHDINRQNKLITTGPFKFSRNPIYLGTFLLLTGLSLSLKSIFFWLPALHLYYFSKQITKEEKHLVSLFGEKYLKYRTKTPKFI